MIKRFSSRYFLTAVMAILPLLYWNCSGIGLPFNYSETSNSSESDPYNANNIVTPGSSGTLNAFQDRYFIITPSSADSGPFTVSGLPAWATFDAATGRVTGVALKTSDTATITIQTGAVTFGPYTVAVVGNPLKEYQWHLKNTGQTAFALTPGTAGEDIHMTNSLLGGLTGAGVRVVISDTGVFIGHEGLKPNLLPGESRNYLLDTPGWIGDPTPDLSDAGQAHGTSVASLVVEKGWNGLGGRGVAPEAKFAGFLFLEAQTALSQAGTLSAARNDQFSGNFDVFNYSWTDPQCTLIEFDATFKDKVKAAITQQRGGKGSLHLMAAGNNYFMDIQTCYSSLASSIVFGNVNFSEMNTNPYIMNIGAVNAMGVTSSYSTPGSALWVSSTGGEYGWDTTVANTPSFVFTPAIVGADFYGCGAGGKTEVADHSAFDRGGAPNTDCKYTSTMNGTSAATPIATGAVALLLQANPNLTWRDVKYILAKTADKVTPSLPVPTHPSSSLNLAGYAYDQTWITNAAGFNFQNYYGFGRINVDKAVAMARNYVSALGNYTETNWAHDSGAINVPIPDASATGVSRAMTVGQALTIEAVQLRVSTTACAGDLGLELTSPSGTRSVLMNINSRIQDGAIQDHTFLSNAFLGETSAGTWTLKVIDGFAGCTASLTNWKLNFAGH